MAKMSPGYRTLIPDLYCGKVGLEVAEEQHLMEALDWQGAIKDIHALVNWLKVTDSPKVGVNGFCMGGAISIASAVLVPEVNVVVAFYRVPSPELVHPGLVKAHIQAHFEEFDNFVGFSDVTAAKALEEKLKSSDIPYEVHIYPGCGHAFLNRLTDGIKRINGMGIDDEKQLGHEKYYKYDLTKNPAKPQIRIYEVHVDADFMERPLPHVKPQTEEDATPSFPYLVATTTEILLRKLLRHDVLCRS